MSNLDSSNTVDVALLASQLASPRRPHLAEARAVIAGASSGEQAWTRLFEHGLIPGELFQSLERRFAVVNTERIPAAAGDDDLDLRVAPATVDAAVTLASDAPTVLETEQLARVLRSRLVAWGARPVERIDWVVLTHHLPFSFRQGPAFNCAIYSLEYALQDLGIDMRTVCTTPPWLPPFVGDVICACEGWAIAASESSTVPSVYGPPPGVVGMPFRALANPFETTLRLWARGYVLDHLCEQDRACARLFTFVVDAPPNLPHRLREEARSREG